MDENLKEIFFFWGSIITIYPQFIYVWYALSVSKS